MRYGCVYISVTLETYDQTALALIMHFFQRFTTAYFCINSIGIISFSFLLLLVFSYSVSSNSLKYIYTYIYTFVCVCVNEKQYLLEDQQSSSIAILHQFSKANRKLDTNDEEERGGWVTGD